VLNPCFEAIFEDGRFEHKRGKWAIALREDPVHSLVDPNRIPTEFMDLIRPMFITQPPCKALGVY
jgi:hypothetical protein